jgi:hypothetical protein
MTRIQALGRFLWDFVIGDDWRIAVAVVLALALTAIVAGAGVSAWWILPVFVAATLSMSLWRVARAAARKQRS